MTGASGSGRTEASRGGLRPSRAFLALAQDAAPALSTPGRSGRNAARHAALKHSATGSGPLEDRGGTGTGLDFDMGTGRQMMMTICPFRPVPADVLGTVAQSGIVRPHACSLPPQIGFTAPPWMGMVWDRLLISAAWPCRSTSRVIARSCRASLRDKASISGCRSSVNAASCDR